MKFIANYRLCYYFAHARGCVVAADQSGLVEVYAQEHERMPLLCCRYSRNKAKLQLLLLLCVVKLYGVYCIEHYYRQRDNSSCQLKTIIFNH